MKTRKEQAFDTRVNAALLAQERVHPMHLANGEEQRYRHTKDDVLGKPSYLMSFTKGLPHDKTSGLVANPDHFELFLRAIDSGDLRDFRDTPLGHKDNCNGALCPVEAFDWRSKKAGRVVGLDSGNKPHQLVNVRAWESQSAGLSFDLEGPDAQAVTMPPAPELGSEELTAEMAEVYAQALLRDVPFNTMTVGLCDGALDEPKEVRFHTNLADVNKVKTLTDKITQLNWFTKSSQELKLNPAESARQRCFVQSPCSAFRGITHGDDIGPYISQFLLAGNKGINSIDHDRPQSAGFISYGAVRLSQQVRTATPGDDHMTCWEEYIDVQNGADLRNMESYEAKPQDRFIHTPRDLATYVHYDALYQAYLSACLLMLGSGIPFDPGIPFQQADNMDHQQGFAHFGGPHILSLVTEVATRALKAVRFQKYNVHRRCRPEVVGGRLEKCDILGDMAPSLIELKEKLGSNGIDLLSHVTAHNTVINKKKVIKDKKGTLLYPSQVETVLLPMAFCEGSPMHPAYGAGHATVAGACVTILKAFFDHNHRLDATGEGSDRAFVSTQNGNKLETVPVIDKNGNATHLTVHGELNKLASNIAIGRNWAGVHYFTDYYESLLMGEKIAIGILEEQKLTYKENFSMTVPLFGGGTVRI